MLAPPDDKYKGMFGLESKQKEKSEWFEIGIEMIKFFEAFDS